MTSPHSPADFVDLERRVIERLLRELAEPEDRTPSGRNVQPQALRAAAVVLVLCPNEVGKSSFVLTRRSADLRHHPGQWALPGGGLEPGESAIEAGLRELKEEVGLHLTEASVLGVLDDFVTRSGFRMTPIVCWCEQTPVLEPDPDEVASVHLVCLSEFDVPEVPLLRSIPESDQPVLSLPVRGMKIHAPTAAIVYQLFELVFRRKLVRVAHFEQPVFAWR